MKNQKGVFNAEFLIVIFIIAAVASIGIKLFMGKNMMAKSFGGTTTVEIPAESKLVNVAWKDGNSLWVLTRLRGTSETAQVYTFSERSNLGLLQGTVILVEK